MHKLTRERPTTLHDSNNHYPNISEEFCGDDHRRERQEVKFLFQIVADRQPVDWEFKMLIAAITTKPSQKPDN